MLEALPLGRGAGSKGRLTHLPAGLVTTGYSDTRHREDTMAHHATKHATMLGTVSSPRGIQTQINSLSDNLLKGQRTLDKSLPFHGL